MDRERETEKERFRKEEVQVEKRRECRRIRWKTKDGKKRSKTDR